jgi:hypothetical protein
MSSCTSFGCSLGLNGSNWFFVSDSYQLPTKAQGLINSQISLVVQPAYSQTDCATQVKLPWFGSRGGICQSVCVEYIFARYIHFLFGQTCLKKAH